MNRTHATETAYGIIRLMKQAMGHAMSLLSGLSGLASEFFGLDIGSTAVRLVQLHGTGPNQIAS